jgi:hypothetical protein
MNHDPSFGYGDIVRGKTKKKRNPRKAAVNAADKWASLDVRLDRDCVLKAFISGHVCKGSLVCGHLFSRVAYSTRWDEANLYPICSWANIRMEDDPVVARQLLEYAEALWGIDIIAQLHTAYERAVPMKTHEIQEAATEWKERYEKHSEWWRSLK